MAEKTRFVHTNWNRYNCCTNRKPYEFRVTVEFVGVTGSDPHDVSLYEVGELMLSAGDAVQNHASPTDDEDDDNEY